MLRKRHFTGQLPDMPTNILSGCQARAARAMLMWSVRQLAQASTISDSSIRRIESGFGVPENVSLDLLVRLREFYEGKGFYFAFDDERGMGVYWKRKERRRAATDRRGGGGSMDAARINRDVIAVIPWIFAS